MIRMTEAQAVALDHLLALLREPCMLRSSGPPMHWLEVSTPLRVWTLDEQGRLVDAAQ